MLDKNGKDKVEGLDFLIGRKNWNKDWQMFDMGINDEGWDEVESRNYWQLSSFPLLNSKNQDWQVLDMGIHSHSQCFPNFDKFHWMGITTFVNNNFVNKNFVRIDLEIKLKSALKYGNGNENGKNNQLSWVLAIRWLENQTRTKLSRSRIRNGIKKSIFTQTCAINWAIQWSFN